MVARWLSVVAIGIGTLVVGYNEERRQPILMLPGGHGIHLTDIVGALLITAGTGVLWMVSRPES